MAPQYSCMYSYNNLYSLNIINRSLASTLQWQTGVSDGSTAILADGVLRVRHRHAIQLELPVTASCYWCPRVLSHEMRWIHPTQHHLTPLRVVRVPVEPEGKDRLRNQSLLDHKVEWWKDLVHRDLRKAHSLQQSQRWKLQQNIPFGCSVFKPANFCMLPETSKYSNGVVALHNRQLQFYNQYDVLEMLYHSADWQHLECELLYTSSRN